MIIDTLLIEASKLEVKYFQIFALFVSSPKVFLYFSTAANQLPIKISLSLESTKILFHS